MAPVLIAALEALRSAASNLLSRQRGLDPCPPWRAEEAETQEGKGLASGAPVPERRVPPPHRQNWVQRGAKRFLF